MSFIVNFSKDLNHRKSNSIDYSSFDSKQTAERSIKLNNNKKVSFNGVEIIDIESYKKFYQSGNLKLETIEKNIFDDCKSCNCTIF